MEKNLPYYMELAYPMDIEWSEEDALFLARVPLLQGCIAHGSTRVEAIWALRRNMEDWFSVALEDGRDIPEPK